MTNLVKELYETIKVERKFTLNPNEVASKIENLNEEELFNLRNEVVKYTDEDESYETWNKMMGLTSVIDRVKFNKGMAI